MIGAGPVRSGTSGLRRIAVFSFGLELGALASAGALLVANGLLTPLRTSVGYSYLLVVAVAIFALLRDAGIVRVPSLTFHRQVARNVLARFGLWGLFQFGAELGSGVRTNVVATTPYVLGAALLTLSVGPQEAAAAASGFAASRGVPFVYRAIAVTRSRNAVARLTVDRGDLLVSNVVAICAVLLLA